MARNIRLKTVVPWMVLLIPLTGCDERLANLATEAADRQARQNELMAELNKDVGSGSRNLVTADSAARQDMAALHRDVQAERRLIAAKDNRPSVSTKT